MRWTPRVTEVFAGIIHFIGTKKPGHGQNACIYVIWLYSTNSTQACKVKHIHESARHTLRFRACICRCVLINRHSNNVAVVGAAHAQCLVGTGRHSHLRHDLWTPDLIIFQIMTVGSDELISPFMGIACGTSAPVFDSRSAGGPHPRSEVPGPMHPCMHATCAADEWLPSAHGRREANRVSSVD